LNGLGAPIALKRWCINQMAAKGARAVHRMVMADPGEKSAAPAWTKKLEMTATRESTRPVNVVKTISPSP
jgi:hypothetical protein